jgi:hypothetical protein
MEDKEEFLYQNVYKVKSHLGASKFFHENTESARQSAITEDAKTNGGKYVGTIKHKIINLLK